jgi:GR25 family glycosyltransferase involved in LPS biosynthesis
LFVDSADYEYRALDEQSIAAYYCEFPEETFDLCTELLDRRQVPAEERVRIEQNRDYAVPYLQEAFLQYDAELVARLAARPLSSSPGITLAVTSCRRLDLFISTICSFLTACTDIERVDRFICVDDDSSADDRLKMQQLFPFFEFIFKDAGDRGHARSLNIIRDTVQTPWLVHLEDDWHFFAQRDYITAALAILEEDPGLGQVLFNRNYAETLEDRQIPGGFRRRSAGQGHRYVVHEHYLADSEAYRRFHDQHPQASNVWWPHYSLRPGVVRTAIFDRIGRFDEQAGHFELDYAQRYVACGFQSAFLDGIFALHAGRLTSERHDANNPNAYQLNHQAQFDQTHLAPITNQDGDTGQPVCRLLVLGTLPSEAGPGEIFKRQSQDGGNWQEIELTTEPNVADYFLLFGEPTIRDDAQAARTIVVPTTNPQAATIDVRRFAQVRTSDRFRPCGIWRLPLSWSRLRHTLPGKDCELSALLGTQGADTATTPAHRLLARLQRNGLPVERLLPNGAFDPQDADQAERKTIEGLVRYRYTIVDDTGADGSYHPILDALLAECLPFYAGNFDLDYIDSRAFIRLPFSEHASEKVIREAIASDAWGRRIEIIRREKRRILDELQLLPTVARIVRGHRFLAEVGVRVINLERRSDRLASFQAELGSKTSPAFSARVVRLPAVDGRELTLTAAIRHTYRNNDFNFRRSIIGCAESHLRLWRDLVHCPAPAFLIFEDDVSLCAGFEGQMAELCGELVERHCQFDIVFIGHFVWQPGTEDHCDASRRPVGVQAFVGADYLGGLFAYLISRQGASKLLKIIETCGIQHGIDRFIQLRAAELNVLVAQPQLARSPLAKPGSNVDTDIQQDFAPLRDKDQ